MVWAGQDINNPDRSDIRSGLWYTFLVSSKFYGYVYSKSKRAYKDTVGELFIIKILDPNGLNNEKFDWTSNKQLLENELDFAIAE